MQDRMSSMLCSKLSTSGLGHNELRVVQLAEYFGDGRRMSFMLCNKMSTSGMRGRMSFMHVQQAEYSMDSGQNELHAVQQAEYSGDSGQNELHAVQLTEYFGDAGQNELHAVQLVEYLMDAGQRKVHTVQLAEYFVDVLSRSFKREDVARANPVSLSEILTMEREGEWIYKRLNPPQMNCETGRCNREEWSSIKAYNWQGHWGPHTILREPKIEGRNDEWSREGIHTQVIIMSQTR